MLGQIHQRLVGGGQRVRFEISELRARLAGDSGSRGGGVNPENMIWIFGSGRSGSTWLRSMMEEMSGHRVWEEPMVGRLFGDFYSKTVNENRHSAEFIMG